MVFVRFELDIPVFGRILEILSIDDCFFFSLELLVTEVFNPHYHAYEVCPSSSNRHEVVNVESLQDHHPLWAYQCYDQHMINTSFVPRTMY